MKKKKNDYKKRFAITLLSSFFIVACQNPSSIKKTDQVQPVLSSEFQTLRTRGYIDVQHQGSAERVQFQALLDQHKRMYMEGKELGVVGFVFGYQNNQSTVVLPKRQQFVQYQSSYPLRLWHKSHIPKKILFSILMYDFKDLFHHARYQGIKNQLHLYKNKENMFFYVDPKNGQIKEVVFSGLDVSVKYGTFRKGSTFPTHMDITEGNHRITWVWKHIEPNIEMEDQWFDVDVPKHFKQLQELDF